ncbi:hypothetical protein J9303_21045, partial [Bacillaceae bacterium Marseille-Q3522]|nr:hypothetical protein [Bacillaceae bacterium Marseille-Q3522]
MVVPLKIGGGGGLVVIIISSLTLKIINGKGVSMKNILYLELKAIYREYRQSQQVSFQEVLFALVFLMSLTFVFFLLNKIDINTYIVLNAVTLLFVLLAVTLKKDHFYDFIKAGKLHKLKIFPRNYILYTFLKGIKYEVIFFVELAVVLLLIVIPIILGGYSFFPTFFYVLFISFAFMCFRNIALIITSIRFSPIWQYLLILMKSIFLSLLFITISYVIQWFSNFEGDLLDVFNQIQNWQLINLISEIAQQNIVSINLIT